MEFCIKKVEELNYTCSENKGADQLHSYCEADLGLVTRMHRKFPFLRHTYDDLKMTALEFTPLLFQLL